MSGEKKQQSKNDKQAAAATAQAVAAAQPKKYSDPFGSLDPTGGETKFTPNESQTQIETRNNIDSQIGNLVNQTPDSFSVEDYYNNPFYETTKRMYQRTIDQERERDTKNLNDSLNARNQLGSSYDALMNRYLNQDYNSRYDQADDQSRMASANAYQQSFQNALETLRGLSNERSAQLDRAYAPAKIAMGYQSSIAPLQNAQAAAYSNLASYYGGRQAPTPGWQTALNAYNSYIGANAKLVGAVAGL